MRIEKREIYTRDMPFPPSDQKQSKQRVYNRRAVNSTHEHSSEQLSQSQIITTSEPPLVDDVNILQQALFVTPSIKKTGVKPNLDHTSSRNPVFTRPNRLKNDPPTIRNLSTESGDSLVDGQDPTPLSKLFHHSSKLADSSKFKKFVTAQRTTPTADQTRPAFHQASRNIGYGLKNKGLLDSIDVANYTPSNATIDPFSGNEGGSGEDSTYRKLGAENDNCDHQTTGIGQNIENGFEECPDKFEYLYGLVTTEIDQCNFETAEFISEMLYTEAQHVIKKSLSLEGAPSRMNSIITKKKNLKDGYRGLYLYCYTLYLNRKYLVLMEVAQKYMNYQTEHGSMLPPIYLNGLAYFYGRCSVLLERNIRKSIKYITDLEKNVWDNEQVSNNHEQCIGYPTAATISCLLGKLYKKLDLNKQSAYYHSKALQNNPYLWESVQSLCNMGVDFSLSEIFKHKLPSLVSTDQEYSYSEAEYTDINSKNSSIENSDNTLKSRKPLIKGLMTKKRPSELNVEESQKGYKRWKAKDKQKNEEVGLQPAIGNLDNLSQLVVNPLLNSNTLENRKLTYSKAHPYTTDFQDNLHSANLASKKFSNTELNDRKKQPKHEKSILDTPPRNGYAESIDIDSIYTSPLLEGNRSPRMFTSPNTYKSMDTLKIMKNSSHRGNLKTSAYNKTQKNSEIGVTNALTMKNRHCDMLMYLLFKSYKSSVEYDIYKSIRILNNGVKDIADYYLNSMPWCLSRLGILYFESTNYKMSSKCFEKVRSLQKTRIENMDIYSTLLWHLKDKSRLSLLSHELLSFEPLSYITWCCIGNLFSVMENREDAIKSFQKSINLNKGFEYGYTLLGHEYLNIESFELAKKCYKKSIGLNSHHYNSYYGLGMCYLKLGNFEEALFYFNKAQTINRSNVVLICCCGLALEKLGLKTQALDYYSMATDLKPDSTLALFKKSYLLMDLQSYTQALENFEKLRGLQPNEPTVHYLLGKLYKIMGRKQDSIKELTIAMTLDPRGSQLVKDAMEC